MSSTLRNIVVIVTLTLMVVGLAVVLTVGGFGFSLPPHNVRALATIFLNTTLNLDANYRYVSAMSPEAVTAIVWDYRGLDTLFETSVMFIAIVGALAISRGATEKLLKTSPPVLGMSLITKTITRITIVMILAVGASIALHGHLTPGGGFQGGATIAVVPMLLIIIFSIYLFSKMITIYKAVTLRSVGLIGIALSSFIVLIIAALYGGSAYIFQNQPKLHSHYGLPSYAEPILLGGTLLFFNVFETLAVAFGFAALFILFTIPEDAVKSAIMGEE
ncbi:MAG: sodium:proton antiporter [Ignisphaera sp.]|nr:sodium:proton antiporter [Ignisphaera sp.]MCX8167876.1 sodium:proton antiporter [Ignisphaera sp.]MDW8085483.1 MnhB domain-containing protein [Ignisphaera sp.]